MTERTPTTVHDPRGARRYPWRLWVVAAVVLLVIGGVVALRLADTDTDTHTDTPRSSSWRLTYSTDFDRPSDLDGWTLYDNAAPNSNMKTGWWSRSHAFVHDGQLVLAGYSARIPDGSTRVVTAGAGVYQHPQIYGRYQARVRFDACDQIKYVTLLWPVSGRWPEEGEIDFAEDRGGDRSLLYGSVVFASTTPGQKAAAETQTIAPQGTLSGWHVVGVEWTPSSVRYTLDGRYWGRPVTEHLPKNKMAFVVQTEGILPADEVETPTRCDGRVDWVKQYAYTPAATATQAR